MFELNVFDADGKLKSKFTTDKEIIEFFNDAEIPFTDALLFFRHLATNYPTYQHEGVKYLLSQYSRDITNENVSISYSPY